MPEGDLLFPLYAGHHDSAARTMARIMARPFVPVVERFTPGQIAAYATVRQRRATLHSDASRDRFLLNHRGAVAERLGCVWKNL